MAAGAVLLTPSSRAQLLAFLRDHDFGPQGVLSDWSSTEDAYRWPKDPSDIPRLLEVLKDEDPTISGAVPPKLASIGKPAVPV